MGREHANQTTTAWPTRELQLPWTHSSLRLSRAEEHYHGTLTRLFRQWIALTLAIKQVGEFDPFDEVTGVPVRNMRTANVPEPQASLRVRGCARTWH